MFAMACLPISVLVKTTALKIRRIGEAAKLMMEAGVIAITAFISPLRADREAVRSLMPHGSFLEVYCRADREVCESRNVKASIKRHVLVRSRITPESTPPMMSPSSPNWWSTRVCSPRKNQLKECWGS